MCLVRNRDDSRISLESDRAFLQAPINCRKGTLWDERTKRCQEEILFFELSRFKRKYLLNFSG